MCGCIHSDRCQVTADLEFIPEGEDTQPDSPLEDTVAVTLKRETSIRRSQRNGRLENMWGSNTSGGEGSLDPVNIITRSHAWKQREYFILPLNY